MTLTQLAASPWVQRCLFKAGHKCRRRLFRLLSPPNGNGCSRFPYRHGHGCNRPLTSPGVAEEDS
eukprot:5456106-Lingulodinium_polyedra.AAC.1